MEVPSKLKIELACDAAIPLLGVYPEKTLIRKDTCILAIIAALLTIAKNGRNLSIHQHMSDCAGSLLLHMGFL